jgi:hypothetical protein
MKRAHLAGEDDHDDGGDEDGGDHHPQFVGDADGRDHRIQREDHIDQQHLRDHRR